MVVRSLVMALFFLVVAPCTGVLAGAFSGQRETACRRTWSAMEENNNGGDAAWAQPGRAAACWLDGLKRAGRLDAERCWPVAGQTGGWP